MKKTALALALVLTVILSLLVFEFQAAILVEGNIWPISSVYIIFPENDKTYYSSNLTARYHASFDVEHKWIVYSLDGAGEVTIYDEHIAHYGSAYDFDGSVTLSGLSAGQHYLEICAKNASGIGGEWHDAIDRVYFNIFTSPAQYYVSIQSPKNGTSYSEPVLLNFTRFGHFPWLYNYLYAVDGQSFQPERHVEDIQHIEDESMTDYNSQYREYTTFGAVCLPNLSVGAHNLTFCSLRSGYVHGDFQTVYFNIVEPLPTLTPTASPEPTPEPEPFPTTLITGSVAAMTPVGIGLLVCFKKRRKNHH